MFISDCSLLLSELNRHPISNLIMGAYNAFGEKKGFISQFVFIHSIILL